MGLRGGSLTVRDIWAKKDIASGVKFYKPADLEPHDSHFLLVSRHDEDGNPYSPYTLEDLYLRLDNKHVDVGDLHDEERDNIIVS